MARYAYTPRDPTSPSIMKWNGIEFRANVFIDFNPIKHSYFVPITRTWVDETSQRVMSVTTETRMSMLEIARSNPDFTIEGEEKGSVPRTGKGKAPKTPEEYRAHAMAWIVAAKGMDDLERWDDEEALREKCGVGDDDLKFLQPHFDAKHKQLSVVAEEEAA